MSLLTFWESTAALRRIEFVTLIVTMIFPIVCSTVLLTIRHRIKSLQTVSSENQGAFYEDTVGRLEHKNRTVSEELTEAQVELKQLRRVAAPRQITSLQEDILLDRLRGIQASPVIVAAYAFEEECAAYAAQIAGVLRKAGWDVTLSKASMNDFKGISLGQVNLTHQSLTGLHPLAQAMTEAQMELRQREIKLDSIAGQLQDGSLLVVVGRK
jgi:ribosomal protein L18E